MCTVNLSTHNQNMLAFEETQNIVGAEHWSFEQGEDFANFICDKYNLTSFDDYHVDTDCELSDYEADCMTLGHDF